MKTLFRHGRELTLATACVFSVGWLTHCSAAGEVADSGGDADAGSAPDAVAQADGASGEDASLLRDGGPTVCGDGVPCEVSVPIEPGRSLVSISGSGPNDIWAVGTRGTVIHSNGATWSKLAVPPIGPTLNSVSVTAAGPAWISGGDSVFYAPSWDEHAATWSSFLLPRSDAYPTASVALAGKGEHAYSLGQVPKVGYIAQLLELTPPVAPMGAPIATALPDNRSSTGTLVTVASPEPGTFWAAGTAGRLVRFQKQPDDPWTTTEFDSHTNAALQGLWVSGSEVWTVGAQGTVRHLGKNLDGRDQFLELDAPTPANLNAVYGFSATDVWVAGDGCVFHYDGTHWKNQPLLPQHAASRWYGIWGSATSDIWFVGAAGLMHRTGSAP